MKVGIVTSYADATGGVQVFTKDLARIFQESCDIHVFGLDSLKNHSAKGREEETVGNAFNELNKKEKYDVVICNGEFGYAVDHPKSIVVFHGNYKGYAESVKDLVPKEITEERLRKAEMQRKSAEGKYVVAVSNFAVKGLEETGIHVDKVINNSTDMSFSPSTYPIGTYALSLARGRYFEKGFDLLKQVADEGIKLRIFSDIQLDSPNVENMPFLEQDKIRDEYLKAAATFHLSRFEGGSLVTLESLASGCPLITTPVGYGSDIAKAIPEFVVNLPLDTEELTEKFQKITKHRNYFAKKGLNYFLKNHNPNKFKRDWISLVRDIA